MKVIISFFALNFLFRKTRYAFFPQRKTGSRMGKCHLRAETFVPVNDSA
jgi:hypothetical protein